VKFPLHQDRIDKHHDENSTTQRMQYLSVQRSRI